MSRLNLVSIGIVCTVLFSSPPARAQLQLRVSVKFVLDANGIRPGWLGGFGGCGELVEGSAISCEQEVLDKFAYANKVYDRLGRGYRFDVVEILDVHGLEQFFDEPTEPNAVFADYEAVRQEMEALITATQSSREQYRWRDNALNIYILNRPDGGGISSTRAPAPDNNPITLIWQRRPGAIVRPMHELGHALGLCHLDGCPPGLCGEPGGDCTEDTLLDDGAWDTDAGILHTVDEIVAHNQHVLSSPDYLWLPCNEKQMVLDVLYNVMAAHVDNDERFDPNIACDGNLPPVGCDPNEVVNRCRHRLTQDQLDKLTDRANAFNPPIATGRTHIVRAGAAGSGNGSSTAPYGTVSAGLQAAESSSTVDIILLRGGVYHESMEIRFPVYLRACRGTAVIGE